MMNPQDTRQYTLLYVDDIPSPYNPLLDFLTDEKGLKIYMAQDGKRAIKKAERLKPDIILMDVFMPEMDGFEAYNILKSQSETQKIPVIFMCPTGLMENENLREKLIELEYVTLPIDSQKLWERIAVLMKLT